MTSEQRTGLFAVMVCFILILMIWSQEGEFSLVEKKILAREERLEEARSIISKNPFLIKKVEKKADKKVDERSLMSIFTQALAIKKMDQQIVSLTPSVDSRKKLDKVRLQLRNLNLKQAVFLSIDLKEEHPTLSELEIDLQKSGTSSWSLTGTWAMPMENDP